MIRFLPVSIPWTPMTTWSLKSLSKGLAKWYGYNSLLIPNDSSLSRIGALRFKASLLPPLVKGYVLDSWEPSTWTFSGSASKTNTKQMWLLQPQRSLIGVSSLSYPTLLKHDSVIVVLPNRTKIVSNPTEFPDPSDNYIKETLIEEPIVKATIIVPQSNEHN